MMTRAKLEQLIEYVLGSTLRMRGFDYGKSTFFRDTPSKVIHLIGVDFDPRTTETMQVLCGVNTRLIDFYSRMHPSDMGYIGAQHLSRKGWSCNSGRWPCSNDEEARASLDSIYPLIPSIVEPWFQEFQTLSSVAEKMQTDHPRQGLDKARLFLSDGNRSRAVETLRQFLSRLAKPKPWDDEKELAVSREQAESLLDQIA